MRREGSVFQGLGAVYVKELADNIASVRMLVLELLVVLTALSTISGKTPPRIPSCFCAFSRWRAIPCRLLSRC